MNTYAQRVASGGAWEIGLMVYALCLMGGVVIMRSRSPSKQFAIDGSVIYSPFLARYVRPLRGKNYDGTVKKMGPLFEALNIDMGPLLYASDPNIEDCVCTGWSLSHFAMYFVLGLLVPDFWVTWLALGVGWEVVEWATIGCHDWLDVAYNIAGLGAGVGVREVILTMIT